MHVDLQQTKVGGFNFELLRAMSYAATGGTELGECLAVATRVEEGNFESWIAEWTRMADRVAQEAEAYLHKGRRISARNAFLRAIKRAKHVPLVPVPTEPAPVESEREPIAV